MPVVLWRLSQLITTITDACRWIITLTEKILLLDLCVLECGQFTDGSVFSVSAWQSMSESLFFCPLLLFVDCMTSEHSMCSISGIHTLP